jgi:hypothetical protein
MCLARACHQRTLRDVYNDTVKEGVPGWAQNLLDRLK